MGLMKKFKGMSSSLTSATKKMYEDSKLAIEKASGVDSSECCEVCQQNISLFNKKINCVGLTATVVCTDCFKGGRAELTCERCRSKSSSIWDEAKDIPCVYCHDCLEAVRKEEIEAELLKKANDIQNDTNCPSKRYTARTIDTNGLHGDVVNLLGDKAGYDSILHARKEKQSIVSCNGQIFVLLYGTSEDFIVKVRYEIDPDSLGSKGRLSQSVDGSGQNFLDNAIWVGGGSALRIGLKSTASNLLFNTKSRTTQRQENLEIIMRMEKQLLDEIDTLVRDRFIIQHQPAPSSLDEIEKLGRLKESGLITQQEFDKKKRELLGL